MVTSNIRKKARRVAERRMKERRKILFEFDSVEWRKAIQQEYLLWPKKDRRHADRRAVGRRQVLRRIKNSVKPKRREQLSTLSGILTSEEREMINQLIQSDNVD